jgi:molecular chaperone GrpE
MGPERTERHGGADDAPPAHPDHDHERGDPEAEAAPGSPEALAEDALVAERVSEDIDELEQVLRERDKYLELAQRTHADFDNYRKRVARDASEAVKRGRAELARDLIPVIDNLERAIAAGRSEGSDPGALGRGVELVHRELRSTLERAGVEAYDPTGEAFDPAWHEALSTRAAEGVPAGTVVETHDPGYRLDGQALRAARVVVSE